MSIHFDVCFGSEFIKFFQMVLRVFLIVVVAEEEKKRKYYSVRSVCEYLMIYQLHTQYEQEQQWKVFNFIGYHTRSTVVRGAADK